MIEALIRDESKLLYILIIRPAKCMHGQIITDSLEVDVFSPATGEHLSTTMPAGGEPIEQVARAIMTFYPVSALPIPELDEDEPEKTNPLKGSPETLESPLEAEPTPPPVTEKLSQEMFPESWRLVQRRMASLDKREAEFIEREKKVEQDIENLRKSQQATD